MAIEGRIALFSTFVLTVACLAGCSEQAPEATVPASLVSAASGEVPGREQAAHVVQGCNIEAMDGRPVTTLTVVSSADRLLLSGWVAGRINQQGLLDESVVAVLASSGSINPAAAFETTAIGTGPRADVARALGESGLIDSGFEVDVDVSGLKPGTYMLVVRRGKYKCAQSLTLQRAERAD